MTTLLWILGATIIVSLLSFIGVLGIALNDKLLKKLLLGLVGLSAGALLGGAFLHLIPESIESLEFASLYVILGFILFFILEKFFYWRHCHKGKCDVHAFTYLNLIGDAVHNFIDGVIIAISFMVDVSLGVITTIAVIAHEIPQELGDFGVLVYGGWKKAKALLFNFLSALTAILGALIAYIASNLAEGVSSFLLPFAAGGFIYIAASDLIPELHRETDIKRTIVSFLFFIIGIALMFGLMFLE